MSFEAIPAKVGCTHYSSPIALLATLGCINMFFCPDQELQNPIKLRAKNAKNDM